LRARLFELRDSFFVAERGRWSAAMLDWLEVIYRLGAATLVGGAIGLNREFHGKPTGVRTLGLVGLGSATVVLAVQYAAPDAAAASRVVQGIITGIGFLGAGIILRRPEEDRVHGMTTAAAIWFTACLGVACGIGAWRIITVASILVVFLLTFGGPIEKALHWYLLGKKLDDGAAGEKAEASIVQSDHDENR
jgi:putative Mg2+ transporter-C (MgtC) family protein